MIEHCKMHALVDQYGANHIRMISSVNIFKQEMMVSHGCNKEITKIEGCVNGKH